MATDPLMTLAYVIHFAFAALWTGSVLFVTYAILPLGLRADLEPTALGSIVGRLTTVTRASATVLLLTGAYQAVILYDTARLTGTARGHAVIGMVVLWFLLAGLVEVGVSKMGDGLDIGKIRRPTADARPFLLAASVVALLLLLDAGVLVAGIPA